VFCQIVLALYGTPIFREARTRGAVLHDLPVPACGALAFGALSSLTAARLHFDVLSLILLLLLDLQAHFTGATCSNTNQGFLRVVVHLT
jgi:hypothetical protein